MKKFSKIFMIFCVLFSQFSGVLEVFAEEIIQNDSQVEEESKITATLDDENNLVIKSDGSLNDESYYDIYLTSSYKYAYDDSEVNGYNNEKVNTVSILGSELNGEVEYSFLMNDTVIDSNYNGTYTLDVKLVEVVVDGDSYSATITKDFNKEDKFDILSGELSSSALLDGTTYEVGEDKDVEFTYTLELPSTIGTALSSVYVNDVLVEDSYSVNYEGMLYGTYIYNWDVEVDNISYLTRDISVAYNSVEYDNEEGNAIILTDANTMGVEFAKTNAYVIGDMSVVDFIDSISMDLYDLKVVELVDSIETEVTEGNVSNGMSLVISKDGLVLTYNIVIVGDVDSDGDVDQDDVELMVESVLTEEDYYNNSADVNRDEVVDIFDVTKTIDALTNGWDNQVVVDEEVVLDPVISSDVTGEVKIGDTITVRFALKNFNESMINGLSGKIEFDSDILSLDEILVTGMEMYYNDSYEFIIYGEDYNSEEDFIELKFTAVGASEEEYISISNLFAAYAGEEVMLSTDSVSISFAVTYTSNVGGDVEEEEEPETTLVNKEVVVNTRRLSSDSYLLDLDIEGYEIDFSPYTFKYNIKVGNDVKSLSLDAILSDYRASYAIYGNEDFKVGENIVTVVVTAEDGSTHTYTIIVDKEEEKVADTDEDKDVEEESNISKTVIVGLIILVIIGLIYLIFKDDEEDKVKKD